MNNTNIHTCCIGDNKSDEENYRKTIAECTLKQCAQAMQCKRTCTTLHGTATARGGGGVQMKNCGRSWRLATPDQKSFQRPTDRNRSI